jgi:DNA-binding NtrC family response regulator
MGEQRVSSAPLAQIFGKASQPVYVLDHKRRLVWCNSAFLEFFAISADAVLQQECRWAPAAELGQSVSHPSEVLAAIAPSPEVFAGQIAEGHVSYRKSPGLTKLYPVRFVRLLDPSGELLGLVGIIEPAPIESEKLISPPGELINEHPQHWHLRLQELLREIAGQCSVERLLGVSPAMERVRRQVRAAAECRAHVLVVGMPGTGRRSTAHAIHYGGSRAESTTVTLSCEVLGAEIVYSTFLAAARFRPGPGELPIGTVILLNVDKLSLEVQREVARTISQPDFRLRVIATSQQPLLELAASGRADPLLASLVSTLVIEIPPLARRPEDIPILAQYFLEQLNRDSDKQLAGFSPEALDYLCAYHWPGNVAELQAVVTETHRRARGPIVQPSDLPERISLALLAAKYPVAKEETIQLDAFLKQIEGELIRRALARARGNKARAARLLGISRPRLLRLLQQAEAKPAARKEPTRQPKPRTHLPPLEQIPEQPSEELPTFEELENSDEPAHDSETSDDSWSEE